MKSGGTKMAKISKCIFIIFILFSSFTYGTVPQKINFQGILTDNNGNIMTGEHMVTFKIFDAEISGTELWQETHYVYLSSGIFSVQLGSSATPSPIPLDTFDSPDRWIEITVDLTTLSPRQKFVSQPYSFVSEKAYQLVGSSITGDNILDGSITGADINPQTTINISTLSLGSDSIIGLIKHRNYDAISIEGTKLTFFKNVTNAKLNMSGNIISDIGALGSSGHGITLSGDGNNYLRIYVASDGWTNSGLYIGSEYGARTGRIDLCSNSISCYGKFYPGTTGGAGWQNSNYIVTDSAFPGYIRTNGSGFTTGGSDVAELIKSEEVLESGDVVVINDNGKLIKCTKEYDNRVIGIISEQAGILLGAGENKSTKGNLKDGYPVALSGRVYVKADAGFGSIKVGDLLTTSKTAGYARKAQLNSWEKVSSVIGKALQPLDSGKGKILVLIGLH